MSIALTHAPIKNPRVATSEKVQLSTQNSNDQDREEPSYEFMSNQISINILTMTNEGVKSRFEDA